MAESLGADNENNSIRYVAQNDGFTRRDFRS